MNATTLLATLQQRGVQLNVEGDHLRYAAAPGLMTLELLEALRKHKQEVVSLLRERTRAKPTKQSLHRCETSAFDQPVYKPAPTFEEQALKMAKMAPVAKEVVEPAPKPDDAKTITVPLQSRKDNVTANVACIVTPLTAFKATVPAAAWKTMNDYLLHMKPLPHCVPGQVVAGISVMLPCHVELEANCDIVNVERPIVDLYVRRNGRTVANAKPRHTMDEPMRFTYEGHYYEVILVPETNDLTKER